MAASLLPFTWPEFERETGQELPNQIRDRLMSCVRDPNPATWENARSIVVAPQMSILGQTLWQCVEAVTMARVRPDQLPNQKTVVMALCYAAGLPGPRS